MQYRANIIAVLCDAVPMLYDAVRRNVPRPNVVMRCSGMVRRDNPEATTCMLAVFQMFSLVHASCVASINTLSISANN
jgi:hypothetical protein